MPAFSIGRVTFLSQRQLEDSLRGIMADFPSLWKKALNDAGDIAQKFLARQFASEGQEFGYPWASLKESTQRDRARKGYKPEHPILVRRGWLRASVVKKRSKNAKRVVTRQGIIMYSTLKTKSGLNLLALHQMGGKYLPARKVYDDESYISRRGWDEIKLRFEGMFIEIRHKMEEQ